MTRAKRVLMLSCSTLAPLVTAATAEAGGFAIREQSAYGQGSSFAGIGAGGSLSSMYWNPATLSSIQGLEIENVISGVIPFVDVDYSSLVVPETGDDIGITAYIPAAYAAQRVTDRLVLGVGMNGSFGLATAFDDDALIKASGVAGTSRVFSLNVNPALSYEVNDWLSVGVGLQLQYLDLYYTALGLPGLGVSDLEADDIGVGFTAGVVLTPLAGTEIGVGYRSSIRHELDGTLTSGAGTEFDAVGEKFDLPDIATIGLRQSITDRFRVMAGAEWSNWSRFDTVDLSIPVATIPLGFDYDDGWFFSAGAEFDATSALTLRGGIGYELSPIDDDTRSFRLPDNDRLWLSAGASYSLNERWSFDAGYSLIMAKDTDILSAASGGPIGNGAFSGSADTNIHIVSVGFKVKFAGPPEPPAPQ